MQPINKGDIVIYGGLQMPLLPTVVGVVVNMFKKRDHIDVLVLLQTGVFLLDSRDTFMIL